MTHNRSRWPTDLDLNSLGPLVRDPSHLSPKSLRRNRLLLDMLLDTGDLITAQKIVAAHPELRVEYEGRIRQPALTN
jgi:hypothetical protein